MSLPSPRGRSLSAPAILARSAARRLSEAAALSASTAFSLMALSIFVAAASSPRFAGVASSLETARRLLSASGAAIAFFVALSGWLHAEHYLRRRKRELAAWLLLGMGKGRAALAVSAEFALAAAAALAAGLGLGALFSRFFALGLSALMSDRSPMDIPFGAPSAAAAAAACAGQWALSSARAALAIRHTALVDLMKSDRAAEAAPLRGRLAPAAAAAGAVLVGAGYACAAFSGRDQAPSLMLPVLAAVVAGTFLLFRAALPPLVGAVRRGRGRRDAGILVASAQLAFRIRRNADLLAFSAVLVATAASALGSVVALDVRDRGMTRRLCPHDLELPSPAPGAAERVAEILRAAGAPEEGSLPLEVEWIEAELEGAGGRVRVQAFAASAWNRAIGAVGEAPIAVGEGELLRYADFGRIEGGGTALAAVAPGAGAAIPVASASRTDLPPLSVATALHPVALDDIGYGRLRAAAGPPALRTAAFWDGIPGAVLRAAAPALAAEFPVGLVSKSETLDGQGGLYGVMLFIGAFLSAAFALAAASLLAFRAVEDARDDADRYLAMLRLGAPRETLRRSLALQNLCAFGAPLAAGLCHAAFALAMMRNITGYSNVRPTLLVSALAALAMGVAARLATDRQETLLEALANRS